MIALRCIASLSVVLVALSSHAQNDEALERRAEFWKLQETRTPNDFAKRIVGKYEGTAYAPGYADVEVIERVVIEFSKDGTFTTNLPNLLSLRSRRALAAAGDPAPPQSGKYRVVSPSQLITSPGWGISTVSPSLHDGVLSFIHLPAELKVVVSKQPPKVISKVDTSNLAGTFVGEEVFVDPSRQSVAPPRAAFELIFSESYEFTPAWIDNIGNRTVFAHENFGGRYLIDNCGELVTFGRFGGSDYVGSSIMPFYDWHLDGTQLHMTAFDWNSSSHLAVSLDGATIEMTDSRARSKLTSGTFRGSVFRAWESGEIVEIPNVWIRFDEDGTYHTNWTDRLRRKDDQYYPHDGGRFLLASPRHLLLAEVWESEPGVVNDATTDLLLSGDRLCFTSSRRKAYFVMERKRS